MEKMGNSNQTAFKTACKSPSLQTVKQFVDQPVKWYESKLDLDRALLQAYTTNNIELFSYLYQEMGRRDECEPNHTYLYLLLLKRYKSSCASEK
jgi:hypothetical protein